MSLPEFETLRLERRGKVCILTLNRPEKKNALNKTLRAEIIQALDVLTVDSKTQAVVIYGGEDVFCAGFDKAEVMGAIQSGSTEAIETLTADTIAFQEALLQFPKLLIAAINGYALAGGFDLAVLCHLRVASETAVFGHPEIGFGACPLFFPYYALVGRGKALELVLNTATADHFLDAHEAHRLNIVNKLVTQESALEEAIDLAKSIGRSPDFAVATLFRVSGLAFDENVLNRTELEAVAAEAKKLFHKKDGDSSS